MDPSKSLPAQPSDVSEKLLSVTGDLPPVILNKAISRKSNQELGSHIGLKFLKKYNQDARELQNKAVLAAARGEIIFLIAGTGYGKTRIAEVFRLLFSVKSLAIVLILNPLDALGDNQVLEKRKDGLKAVNLTALNFTSQVAHDIEKGVYSFIYLSPEIFLTNRTWLRIYNSIWFWRRLILKVVDEAQMIYEWGLVESGQAKHMSVVKKGQDGGKFRPSWGKLCIQLMATRHVPFLLMSATCPEPHFDAIINNLSIKRKDITLLEGELCRPEIRLLRVGVAAMGSLDFLNKHFSKRVDIPDSELVPTLVYSGSCNGTMHSLRAMNKSRDTKGDESNPDM